MTTPLTGNAQDHSVGEHPRARPFARACRRSSDTRRPSFRAASAANRATLAPVARSLFVGACTHAAHTCLVLAGQSPAPCALVK